MKRAIVTILVASALTSASAAVELTEIAPGVLAAMVPHAQRFQEANTIIAIRSDHLVVVDPPARPARARMIIEAIERSGGKPVRFLVHTHWHGDHVQTAALFRERWPRVEVIAHAAFHEAATTRGASMRDEEVARYEKAIATAKRELAERSGNGDELESDELRDLAAKIERAERHVGDIRDLPYIRPAIEIESTVVLHDDAGPLRIIPLTGHTAGDLVLHFPNQNVLLAGDLVDPLPYGGDGDLREWIESLRAIEALHPRIIVPGHGSVLGGSAHLDTMTRFFRDALRLAREARAAGRTIEDLLEEPDLLEGWKKTLAGSDKAAVASWDFFVESTLRGAWNALD